MTDSFAESIWTSKLNALVGSYTRTTSSCIPLATYSFQEPNRFSYLYNKNTDWTSKPTHCGDLQESERKHNEACPDCSCISTRPVAINPTSNSLYGIECCVLSKKCLPHPNCQRHCRYRAFVDSPHANWNYFRPNSFLSDSASSTEEDSVVFPSLLEYYSDSATDSQTSISQEAVSSSSSQIHAHIDALSLLESKRHVSSVVENSPLTIKSCWREVASPLWPSLFHNVSPFIHFHNINEEVHPLPVEVRRLLQWKLSPITPVVVRQIVVRSGFRLARKSTDWSGTWGKHMKSLEFRFIKDVQKVNHFPGSHHLGRKDNLLNHIRRSKALFKDTNYNFLPETYLLPKELKQFHHSWKATGTRQPWIVKPPASARGSGIYVICKWPQVPKKQPSIVQRYISKPYLINGSKFDLRVYVLVTNFNPLKIYIYPDGLVRFASVKYSTSFRTLSDRFMHLTNYSVNKKNVAYVSNEDQHSQQGHKWTLKALWSYLKDNGEDVGSLWEKIVDIATKTIVSVEGSFNPLIDQNVTSSYTCFELFGFDIMLDDQLKPWLLEVNISPSLQATSSLDASVKTALVKDMFNIVGFHIPDRMNAANQQSVLQKFGLLEKTGTLCINRSYYHTALTHADKMKHEKFIGGRQTLSSILDELSPDDVRKLMQSEDEFARRGHFIRIFPTGNSFQYLELMLSNRYYNLLLLAWEIQYSSNREGGIRHLQSFAEADYHLQTSWKLPLFKEDSILTDSSDDVMNTPHIKKPDRQIGRIWKLAYKTGFKTKRVPVAVQKKVLHKTVANTQQETSVF